MLVKIIMKDPSNNVNTKILDLPEKHYLYDSVTFKFFYDKRTFEYVFVYSYTTERGRFIKCVKRMSQHAIREWITREFFKRFATFKGFESVGTVLRKMLNEANKVERKIRV